MAAWLMVLVPIAGAVQDAAEPPVDPARVQDLLRRLGSEDFAVRDAATEGLVDLWHDDGVRRRVTEELEGTGDAEVGERCRLIQSRGEFRRLLGRPLQRLLGAEALKRMEGRGDGLLDRLEEALRTPEGRKEAGLEGSERPGLLVAWLAGRRKEADEKRRLIRLAREAGLSGSAAAIARYLDDPDSVPEGEGPDRRFFQVRAMAAEALGILGARDQVGRVAALLEDPEALVRVAAAESVGLLQGREFADAVAALLRDDEAQVRWTAARVLGTLDSAGHADLLAACLKDPDTGVRMSAAKALGRLQARRHAGEIARLLEDSPYSETRRMAALALGELGSREHAREIAGLLRERFIGGTVAISLGLLGARDYEDDIAAMLLDEAGEHRGDAACALALMGASGRAKDIAGLLKDPAAWNRGYAAAALGRLGARDYAAQLEVLAGDPSRLALYDPAIRDYRVTTVGAVASAVLESWRQAPARD